MVKLFCGGTAEATVIAVTPEKVRIQYRDGRKHTVRPSYLLKVAK